MSTSKMPTRKVNAAVLSGAFVAILVWMSREFFKVDVPADVAVAASTLIGGVIAYFVPDAAAPEETEGTP